MREVGYGLSLEGASRPISSSQCKPRVNLSLRNENLPNAWRWVMADIERYDMLVIGSGEPGKHLTWNLAQAGHRTAVVERKYVGGSCPNIACLPSKNVIRSAKANWFAKHGEEYGIQTGPVSTDMRGVLARKRKMVEGEVQFHLDRFKATGAELIGEKPGSWRRRKLRCSLTMEAGGRSPATGYFLTWDRVQPCPRFWAFRPPSR